MRIQGHSADDGRHAARRQQYRMRDTTEEQHGRHILSVHAHAEMEAQFGAVAALERSDHLSARHRFAL
jgi:hypothetical protein